MNDYDIWDIMRQRELQLRRSLPQEELSRPETQDAWRLADVRYDMRKRTDYYNKQPMRDEFPSVNINSEIRVKK